MWTMPRLPLHVALLACLALAAPGLAPQARALADAEYQAFLQRSQRFREAEEQLNILWKQLTARMSVPEKNALLAEQRRWLAGRERMAQGLLALFVVDPAEIHACLTMGRVAELGQAHAVTLPPAGAFLVGAPRKTIQGTVTRLDDAAQEFDFLTREGHPLRVRYPQPDEHIRELLARSLGDGLPLAITADLQLQTDGWIRLDHHAPLEVRPALRESGDQPALRAPAPTVLGEFRYVAAEGCSGTMSILPAPPPAPPGHVDVVIETVCGVSFAQCYVEERVAASGNRLTIPLADGLVLEATVFADGARLDVTQGEELGWCGVSATMRGAWRRD